MSQITRRRIRLALDIAKKTSERFTDVRHSGTPELWKGNDVQFELGLFDAAVISADISNIASLTLTVRQTSAAGTVLMTKTLSAGDLTACDQAAWTAATGYHALVSFTGQEANIAAGDHWLVVDITTNDSPGRSVTLGVTTIKIVDDGAGTEADAQAADGTAYTKSASDARYIQKHANDSWKKRYDDGTGERDYHYIASTNLWYPEVAIIQDGIPILTLGEGVAL
jgi:hypothetical protein